MSCPVCLPSELEEVAELPEDDNATEEQEPGLDHLPAGGDMAERVCGSEAWSATGLRYRFHALTGYKRFVAQRDVYSSIGLRDQHAMFSLPYRERGRPMRMDGLKRHARANRQ